MADLVDVLGLRSLLNRFDVSADVDDFERLYDHIAADPNLQTLREDLEHAVADYFSDLELPDSPTIYDFLLLSLRDKDFIASFNWDPFLWDAWIRNRERAPTPRLAFLHGNVRAGYCETDRKKGPRWARCPECREPFSPSPLLFPVAQKDYASNPFLAGEWRGTQQALNRAWIVTVFGYGAPRTDVEAIDLFRQAWGELQKREFEEFEFIDIADKDALRERWEGFVFEHHYQVARTFETSLLARHPRRSCEAMWAQLIDARWVHHAHGFSSQTTFEELDQWLAPLVEEERKTSPSAPNP